MADQVLHQCQGHTHIQILFQDECFEVFCSQPWSLLMPPVFWQFFVGLFATAHTPQGHFLVLVYQRRTAGSWKHTHRWKWRLCHGSVSPFKVLKRKKAEQKQSVCVCVWSKSRLLGKANSLRLPLSKPHMDIQRQAQPSASPLEILVKNTCFKMFSAKNLQIHPSGWFWKSVETHLSFSLFS